MEKASGNKIPYKICARRDGDVASCYADPNLASKELEWKATRGLEEMCMFRITPALAICDLLYCFLSLYY